MLEEALRGRLNRGVLEVKEMEETEDPRLPAFARRVTDGMRLSISQKWYEAAITFFSRATINRAVSIECQIAGFSDARHYFQQRALYFIAEGFRCLGKAGQWSRKQ